MSNQWSDFDPTADPLAKRVAEWCRTATDSQRQDLELAMIPKRPVPYTFGILRTNNLRHVRMYYFHLGGMALATGATACVAGGAWWVRRSP